MLAAARLDDKFWLSVAAVPEEILADSAKLKELAARAEKELERIFPDVALQPSCMQRLSTDMDAAENARNMQVALSHFIEKLVLWQNE